MKPPQTDIPNVQNDRKKRLAEALRQNLQLRKARERAAKAPPAKKGGEKPTPEGDKA